MRRVRYRHNAERRLHEYPADRWNQASESKASLATSSGHWLVVRIMLESICSSEHIQTIATRNERHGVSHYHEHLLRHHFPFPNYSFVAENL
jgi:hypothetical protein